MNAQYETAKKAAMAAVRAAMEGAGMLQPENADAPLEREDVVTVTAALTMALASFVTANGGKPEAAVEAYKSALGSAQAALPQALADVLGAPGGFVPVPKHLQN